MAFAEPDRRRIGLPGYPFQRQRRWIDPPDTEVLTTAPSAAPSQPTRAEGRTYVSQGPVQPAANDHRAAADEGRALADWFYVPKWRRCADGPKLTGRVARGDWLLFVNSCGLGERLTARIRRQGGRVVTVTAGRLFSCHGEGTRARSVATGAVRTVAGRARLANSKYRPSLERDASAIQSGQCWDEAQSLGLYSLLFLIQNHQIRQGLPDNLSLHMISSHMQQVVGAELSSPEKATLLGVVRVAPELPGTRCRSIDLVVPPGGTWDDGLLDRLTAELVAHDFATVTAIREDAVWEESFAARRLVAPRAFPARLREGGTYLITGGLGSMGLALARWLARDAHAKLVLLGRTALPPEREWDRWLGEGETARVQTQNSCMCKHSKIRSCDRSRLVGAYAPWPNRTPSLKTSIASNGCRACLQLIAGIDRPLLP